MLRPGFLQSILCSKSRYVSYENVRTACAFSLLVPSEVRLKAYDCALVKDWKLYNVHPYAVMSGPSDTAMQKS